MNILLIHELIQNDELITFGAVAYYRMQKPHEVLKRMYPEFDFITSNTIDVEEEIIKQTDLILFTRIVSQEDIDKVNKWGKPWGLDVDDYWHLPDDHLLAISYKDNDIPAKIENALKQAHFVMCTTEILADKVKPFNSNVYVIENGIDTQDESWKPNKKKSDRIRFGFTQGTTHVPDIMLINKSVQKSLYDIRFHSKGQIVLCGFNAKFNKESIYVGYERLLTDNLKPMTYNKDYIHKLKTLKHPYADDMPYKRIWGVDVREFGKIHNELDIVVAPLKSSEFNSCKSNIKMLEAGFMDCAVMVHNVSPYKELATKENSFNLTESSFFELQRYIIMNPSLVEEKKQALKEDVQKFELSKLTDKRKQLYESVSN